MGLGLIGLLAIQVYWVSDTVRENRRSFQQSVHKSLNNVVHQLEYRENIEMMRRQSANDPEMLEALQQLPRNTDLSERPQKQDSIKYIGYSEDGKLNISINPDDTTGMIRLSDEKLTAITEGSKSSYLQQRMMLAEIMMHLSERTLPIESRLNYAVLDSMLSAELSNAGIETYYEFLVLNVAEKEFFFVENPNETTEILEHGFKHRLFPSDIKRSDNFLYVYFPQENSYLLGHMTLVLSSSILFIGLMSVSFVLAIRLILRQKDLTDATTDFVNNMTHEFRTPIATVSLATEMLSDDGMRHLPDQHSRYVSMIKDETKRLSRLVEKVLQSARMERGDLEMVMKPVDIHEIAEDAIQNVILLIEQREGTLTTQFDASKSVLSGDFLHLNNIISGLLDNANKYSPKRPKIRLTTHNVKNGIVINVFDNGKGISKDEVSKIFDRFYRVSTGDVHDVKGFGLGLSYVKTVVDAHHGDISVKSELGKGTCFTVFLPFEQHHHP